MVKIAKHHTWNGLEVVKAAPAAATAREVGGGKTKQVKRKLKPGVDFEWKDIGGLTGAAKRQAIIANAKSKSSAYKALKASGQDMMVVTEAAPAAGGAAPAAPQIVLPEIENWTLITEDMDPTALRKARIGNAKAKSAYNKQLKALDINTKDVEWTDEGPKLSASAQAAVNAAAAQAAAAPPPAAAAAPVAAGSSVDLPEMDGWTVITDGMEDADLRKARIANAKAKSAYNKQLKALGINPKEVDSGQTLGQLPSKRLLPRPPLRLSLRPRPLLAFLLVRHRRQKWSRLPDDMPADEVRAARIANAKAKSAYKKELKALGIDPKSVKI